jgi:hypothetical protein
MNESSLPIRHARHTHKIAAISIGSAHSYCPYINTTRAAQQQQKTMPVQFAVIGIPEEETCLKFIALVSSLSAIAVCLVGALFGHAAVTLFTFVALFLAGIYLVRLIYGLSVQIDELTRKVHNLMNREWRHEEEKKRNRRLKFVTATAMILDQFGDIFKCPILFDTPDDPVLTSTGMLYSKEKLREWFLTQNSTLCPMTKAPIKWYVHVFAIKQVCDLINEMKEETKNSIRKLEKEEIF